MFYNNNYSTNMMYPSMMGFGCGNTNAMWGLYAANAVSQFGSIFLQLGSAVIQSKVAEKRENNQNPEYIQGQIDAKLTELGATEENYKSTKAKEQSWYVDGLQEQTNLKTQAENYINQNRGQYITDKSTVQNYRIAKGQIDTTTPEGVEQLRQLTENYEAAKLRIEQYENMEKQLKQAEKAIEKLDAKAGRVQNRIDNDIVEISELISKRNQLLANTELEEEPEEEKLTCNRQELEELFGTDGKLIDKTKEYTKAQITAAVNCYIKAKATNNTTECDKWKARISEMVEYGTPDLGNDLLKTIEKIYA